MKKIQARHAKCICLFFHLLVFVNIALAQEEYREDTIFTRQLRDRLSANRSAKDSSIAQRFLNDTLELLDFADKNLPGSIIPNRQISYWELNRANGNHFRNVYNTANGVNQSSTDSAVLTKCKKGFGSICAPGWCSWFISAKMKDGNIATIENSNGLKFFIGYIDNQYDAYLWLLSFVNFESTGIPLKTTEYSKYKILPDGYLIKVNVRVKDCVITYADLLYFVGKDKKVTFIQVLKTIGTGSCI